jgi:hypothetical protein
MAFNDLDFDTKAADVFGLSLNRRRTLQCSALMRKPPFNPWIDARLKSLKFLPIRL